MSIIHLKRVFFGRFINNNAGKYVRNTVRTQLGILCVRGPRKFQLITITVANIDIQFIMNVNNKYLAINGSANDVGGNIFDTSNKNTTNANRIEMPSVTFSPL